MAAREALGDDQPCSGAENDDTRGYDAGKRINERKRHIATYITLGHLIVAVVHAANIQDRDRAPLVVEKIRLLFLWLRRLIADAEYAGERLRKALPRMADWLLDIVKRSNRA